MHFIKIKRKREWERILTTFNPIHSINKAIKHSTDSISMGHPIKDRSFIHSLIRIPKHDRPTRFPLRHSIPFGNRKWIEDVLLVIVNESSRYFRVISFPQFICFRSLVRGTVRFACWRKIVHKFKQTTTKFPLCVGVSVCENQGVIYLERKESAVGFFNTFSSFFVN